MSYFRSALLDFLREYHPHIAGNTPLVDMRAGAAEELFHRLVHEGTDIDAAHSLALEELFTGLEFSLYYMIYDIIREDRRIPADRYRTLSGELLPLCNPILDNYKGTDLLEDETGYALLQNQVKAIIKQYLEDHGI